ncbi:unnamed protein product [Tenebrio molitor]|nr:unnamed protein product [Tenebrio molitor]
MIVSVRCKDGSLKAIKVNKWSLGCSGGSWMRMCVRRMWCGFPYSATQRIVRCRCSISKYKTVAL